MCINWNYFCFYYNILHINKDNSSTLYMLYYIIQTYSEHNKKNHTVIGINYFFIKFQLWKL